MKVGAIKAEIKQEPVEITEQDVAGASEIVKQIVNLKTSKIRRNKQDDQEKEIIEYQNEASFINAAKDKETLLINFTSSGESGDEYVSPREYTILRCKQWHCNHCEFTANNFSLIEEHIKTKHKGKVKTRRKGKAGKKRDAAAVDEERGPDSKKARNITAEEETSNEEGESQNEVKKFECHTCGKSFKTKVHLVRHVTTHMSIVQLLPMEKAYKCPHCPKIYRMKDRFDDHLLSQHNGGQTVYCKLCNAKFRSKGTHAYHVRTRHGDFDKLETVKCNKCDFSTRYKSKLISHKMKCQKTIRTFQCEKCAFQTSTKVLLKIHQMTHKKLEDHELKYKCDKCDYKTYRQYSLQVHKLNHLKPEEIEYFYCYHCDFKAKRKDNLKTHVLRHFKKEEVKFKCYICDFSTKKRQIIVDHISEHGNKKQ